MTIELALPFAWRWIVRNSPADRVPSHGTTRFASAHAIDFVPVGGDQSRWSRRIDDRPSPFEFPMVVRPLGGTSPNPARP